MSKLNIDKLKLYYRSPYWLQNIFISSERWLEKIKYHKIVQQVLKELELAETWDDRKLEASRMEKFIRLYKHAYENVPYYHRLFKKHNLKPEDVRRKEDITKIPFLTKDIVKNNFRDLIARGIKPKNLIYSQTSGTTGSPFEFCIDKHTHASYLAHVIRYRKWWGYNSDEYCASFGGKVIVPPQQSKPPFWRYDQPEKLIVFSSFHLKPIYIDQMIELIRQKNIRYIKGYPSNLFILAQYLCNKKNVLPMKCVFAGAEPIFESMREVIETQFATKIAEFYAQAERAAMGYQCPERHGYHIAAESVLVEIIGDDGQPVELGEHGEIIGTSLTNFAMPFIRYRTGDTSRILTERCPCGRQMPLLDKVIAKFEDIVIARDGRLISPSALTHPFKPLDSRAILKSQIIQNEIGKIDIWIVRGATYDKAQEKLLSKNFEERFQNQLDVKIVYTSDIQKTAVEKYRWVICNIPLDYKKWALKPWG